MRDQQQLIERYVRHSCGLSIDGTMHVARITGRLNDHATISPDNAAIPTVDFSWRAVERIMASDGVFYA